MPSERCSDGIFYGFGFDFNLFCLKYRLKTRIATRPKTVQMASLYLNSYYIKSGQGGAESIHSRSL
ncbi:hypothetical protein [Neisseria meningitidis]|uniref:hypothetical protein n=1 Tax=Neisseria meningitidis TaxID=487 RepID=UPI001E374ED0|nr:hypothetical protein [Neisseria meningitidis]